MLATPWYLPVAIALVVAAVTIFVMLRPVIHQSPPIPSPLVNAPEDAGILVTVVDYGPDSRVCDPGCYCKRGITLGRAENRDGQGYCVANWRDLVPIVPPTKTDEHKNEQTA